MLHHCYNNVLECHNQFTCSSLGPATISSSVDLPSPRGPAMPTCLKNWGQGYGTRYNVVTTNPPAAP
jgi:hypothetical protein